MHQFSNYYIPFRYKIYRFCKNILYCFHLLREKYRVVEKFGISLRPEAHIQTITPLFKWQLPTLKTDYNRLIRFLLKNILSYWCKLNQCFKQTFQWSGGIELIWIGFPNKNKGAHQRRGFHYLSEWKLFKQNKNENKKKRLNNFNTVTKSGTEKIEASLSVCLKQFWYSYNGKAILQSSHLFCKNISFSYFSLTFNSFNKIYLNQSLNNLTPNSFWI